MEFWNAVFGLARRVFIGPPILAAAVVAGIVAFLLVPTQYTVNVVLLVTSPGNVQPEPGEPLSAAGRTNPLLHDTAGLRTTAAALILATSTPEVLAQLGAPKEGPHKLVIDDGSSNRALFGTGGPFLSVTAESPDAKTARDLVVRTQARLEKDLADTQRRLGAPEVLYITLVNVTPPSTPEAQLAGKAQAAGVTAVLAILVGFAAAYVWTLRAARLRAEAASAEDALAENAWSEVVDEVEPGDDDQVAAVPDVEPEPEREVEPLAKAAGDGSAGSAGSVGSADEDDEDDEDATATQAFPAVELPSPRP